MNWILDCDIRGFFDNLSHDWLVKFVQHGVADHRILGLIQKWLQSGVMEESEWKDTEMGPREVRSGKQLAQVVFEWAMHYRETMTIHLVMDNLSSHRQNC